jgi:predicted nucleotidyltransferase
MSVAELKTELERILKRLKCDPSVRKVLLFGSLARGDARDHSDIDLIVVKDTTMRFLDRLDEFYDDAREAMDVLACFLSTLRSVSHGKLWISLQLNHRRLAGHGLERRPEP